jgi:hypothetical protein
MSIIKKTKKPMGPVVVKQSQKQPKKSGSPDAKSGKATAVAAAQITANALTKEQKNDVSTKRGRKRPKFMYEQHVESTKEKQEKDRQKDEKELAQFLVKYQDVLALGLAVCAIYHRRGTYTLTDKDQADLRNYFGKNDKEMQFIWKKLEGALNKTKGPVKIVKIKKTYMVTGRPLDAKKQPGIIELLTGQKPKHRSE